MSTALTSPTPGYSWVTCSSDCSAFLCIDLLLRHYCRVEETVNIPHIFPHLSFEVQSYVCAMLSLGACCDRNVGTVNVKSQSLNMSLWACICVLFWNVNLTSVKYQNQITETDRTDARCRRYVVITAVCASLHAWDICGRCHCRYGRGLPNVCYIWSWMWKTFMQKCTKCFFRLIHMAAMKSTLWLVDVILDLCCTQYYKCFTLVHMETQIMALPGQVINSCATQSSSTYSAQKYSISI